VDLVRGTIEIDSRQLRVKSWHQHIDVLPRTTRMTAGMGAKTDHLDIESLEIIVDSFRRTMRMLPYYDRRIAEAAAEYFVAYQLSKKGFRVQMGKLKKDSTADIYLPDQNIAVEVKSAQVDGTQATFSFGKGTQLRKKKFDIVVCVSIEESEGRWNIGKIRIIRLEEIDDSLLSRAKKIAESYSKGTRKARKEARDWADHPDTNPCLLYTYGSMNEYLERVKKWRTRIEMDLHKNSKRYLNRWDKISACKS